MWLVETRVFPWVYWNRVLEGSLARKSRFHQAGWTRWLRWLGLAHRSRDQAGS